jgi:hypothetical protein
MPGSLSSEETAILIKARQIQKAKGLKKDADVKSICEAAGISRKTGYQWAKGLDLTGRQDNALEGELNRLNREYDNLKERCHRLEWENKGHKLALKIHGVEELLAAKKNTTHKGKKKKR